jgi:hypothetical protein
MILIHSLEEKPMHLLTKLSAIGLLAGALALGGCASNQDLQKAQTEADQAAQQAQSAQATAQKAQASADQAQSEVQALNAKFDSMVAEEQAERTHVSNMHKHHEMEEHHHKKHHHHKHH